MARGNYAKAEESLASARELADGLKESPKLRFHAYLSLAQLACRWARDLRQAQKHYDAALRVGDETHQLSSYLLAKAAAIRKDIETLEQDTAV